MKKNLCFLVVTLVALCLGISTHASAAGFALPEQGAAAMGMGSAFAAQADDASAVWYNPAGITQLNGTNVMSGFVVILPTFSHENTNGTTDTASRASHVPALLYVTHKVNDSISLGFGVNNPFGMGTDWHFGSTTREVALLSQVLTTEFNPNIAYKINDKLSVSAGLAYVYMTATLSNMYPTTTYVSQLRGSGEGWGGNVAAMYKVSDTVKTGISYRSRVRVDLDGIAQVVGPTPPFPAPSTVTTSITLPDLLSWGISVKPTDKLTLNLDLGYTWWSTYDKIQTTAANSAYNHTYEKQWNDVLNIRVGGQYKLNDNWKLRAGYQYDKNPVPDHYFETRVPDADRHGFTIGAGYTIGNLSIDVAYLYMLFETRNVSDSLYGSTLNGTYNTDVQIFGMSVAYKF